MQADGPVHRRGAPAAHHRQDRVADRPPGRRVEPDGRRPAPRRQPRQRGRAAAGGGRVRADDPEVRRRPAHRRRPDQLRVAEPPDRRLPATPASGAGSTSSCPAAPARERRRRSTCCRRSCPNDERIVTIEDAAELQLKQEHVVRLESRPANIEGKGAVTIRDLVKNSLRMRPDRIIVGEVRDASALDMLQAMNTGHDGSICTLHSNGPRDTLSRMETMVLMAGMDLPMRAIREQVASAVDLIVHQARLKDGTRRITHITEVERMEGDVITLQDIFVFDNTAGFDADGRSLGRLRAHRAAPEVPREDGPLQRDRGPAALPLGPDMSRLRRVVGAVVGSGRADARPGDRRLRRRRHHRPRRAHRRRAADPGLGARRTPTSTSTACRSRVDGEPADAGAVSRTATPGSSAPRSWRSTPASRWPAPASRRPSRPRWRSSTRSRTTCSSGSSPSTPRSPRRWHPPTDRDEARAVIESLSLSRDTLLYDGVLSALELAGDRGPALGPGAVRRRRHQHHHDPVGHRGDRDQRGDGRRRRARAERRPDRPAAASRRGRCRPGDQLRQRRPERCVRRRGRGPGQPGAGHRARSRTP